MARVWTEGFELGDLLFFDANTNGLISSAQSRSGTYSALVGANTVLTKNVTAAAEGYVRWCLYNTSLGGPIPRFDWNLGAANLGGVRYNVATGFLDAYRDASNVAASGTIDIQFDTWYEIETYIKIADSPNGRITVKVDGVTDIDFTGDTRPGTPTQYDCFKFHNTQNAGGWHLDDLAYDPADWPGDGHVICLMPNAAGDNTGLTASAGSNYDCVNERPPNGDTDYVSSATIDLYDLYNLAACGLTNPTVLRVWAEARARQINAAGGQILLGLKTNATEYWAAADLDILTSYMLQLLGTVHTVNPNTTAAWTTTQLDALQVGVKVR